VTFLNKETVMTIMYALKTVATLLLDANINQPTAKMEINAQLIYALKKRDVITLTNLVMTRTHVLLTLAMLLLDNVYSLQNHAQTLTHALLIVVMQLLDNVSIVSKIAMTTMHVLLMIVILPLDAPTDKLSAMIKMLAPKIAVILKLDVYLLL